MSSPTLSFEQLLEELAESSGEGDQVTVEELLDAVGRRAYGPILLLLGFVALSPLTFVPGANWLVAFVTLIIAGQIALGRRTPWIPRKALNAGFPRRYLEDALRIGRPWARRIDWFTRPRLTFLTEAPFIQLVALACVGAAVITFPLGTFPLGPFLPSLAIFLFGLGLAARDGLVLMLSGVSLAGAGYVLWRVGGRLLNMISSMF